MIRVAIFTEGQSELIFTRNLLFMIFNFQYLSIDCLRLHGGRESKVYSHKDPQAKYYFQIVDVGSDSKVISYIREQFDYLIAKDFEVVIGLKDLYSKAYRKRSKVVDENVNRLFIETQTKILDDISGHSNRIKLFFEIMEFEAWLLSMPHLFEKISPQLTTEFIEQNLGFDLETIVPQYEFIHPAMQFGEILKLIGVSYKKSKDQLESIVSKITSDDIDDALEKGKCPAFADFFSELYEYSIQ